MKQMLKCSAGSKTWLYAFGISVVVTQRLQPGGLLAWCSQPQASASDPSSEAEGNLTQVMNIPTKKNGGLWLVLWEPLTRTWEPRMTTQGRGA